MNPNQGAGWQSPGFGAQAMIGMPHPDVQSAKTMAIIGSVLSVLALIIGWCCSIGFVLGPLGAVLGFVSRYKLKQAGSQEGMALAYFAIGLGIFATLLPIVFILFLLIVGSLS